MAMVVDKPALTSFERFLEKENLLQELGKCIYSPEFDDKALVSTILSPMPDSKGYEAKRNNMTFSSRENVANEVRVLFSEPVLTREQEYHLFRQYNYHRYQAQKLMDQVERSNGRVVVHLKNAVKIKKFLAQSNMRLAVSVAKNYAKAINSTDRLWEFVSETNLAILRAIPLFNFTLGNKFSTYVTWAMRNNMMRAEQIERTRKEQNVNYSDFDFGKESDFVETEDRKAYLAAVVNELMGTLDHRSKMVLNLMFIENRTLAEVGDQLGLTRERVRQIKAIGLERMRGKLRRSDPRMQSFMRAYDRA
jgi:RNA polymerase primary sigma factor